MKWYGNEGEEPVTVGKDGHRAGFDLIWIKTHNAFIAIVKLKATGTTFGIQ